MADENQTQTSNEPAGAGDIENIMSGMSEAKTDVKPGENAGEKSEGKQQNDSGKGEAASNPAWMTQLHGDILNNKEAAEKLGKFGKISDLATKYLELEGKLGNTLVKPGDDASDEEKEAFYKALGKPESADKYTIEGENAELFRNLAYKNNLTDDQAKAVYAAVKELGENAIAQMQANYQQQAKATQEALQSEYGKDYTKKIEMLKRGVNTYGGKEVAEKLQQAGLLADKDIVKMFILLGEQSAEAGAPNKSEKTDGYKSIQNGGHLSFGDSFKDK